MGFSVKFKRKWSFFEDDKGTTERHVPAGWRGELDDDIAAAALAEGAAEPMRDITPSVQRLMDTYSHLLNGATPEEAAALADAAAGETIDPETGEITVAPPDAASAAGDAVTAEGDNGRDPAPAARATRAKKARA